MVHLRRYLLPVVAAAIIGATLVPAAGAETDAGAPGTALASPATVGPAAEPATGQLTLADALARADKHSLQIQQATIQVPKARSALDRWKAAGAAGGSALALGLQMRYGVSLPGDDVTATALRRSYENTLEQASLGVEAARQSVRLAVTKAYVEWQKADALVGASQAALTRAQAQSDLARKAEGAGTASHYDVIQADAQVSAQKATLTAARSGRDTARLMLERLIGVPVDAGLSPEPPAQAGQAASSPVDAVPPLTDADSLIDRALKQRPDVAIGKLNVQAKEADLDLLGQYFPADDPLVAGARLAVQEAALGLESTRADIRLQVQQSLLAIASANERLSALAEGEAQSREALRLAQLRFEAGTATTVEVVTAQAALSAAEASRIQAAADLAAAQATLQQATGDL